MNGRVLRGLSIWYEEQSHAKIEIHFGSHDRLLHDIRYDVTSFDMIVGAGLYVPVCIRVRSDAIIHLHIYQYHPAYLFHVKSGTVSEILDRALGFGAVGAVAAGTDHAKFGLFQRFGDTMGYQRNPIGRSLPDDVTSSNPVQTDRFINDFVISARVTERFHAGYFQIAQANYNAIAGLRRARD